jgi:hypothetical protein
MSGGRLRTRAERQRTQGKLVARRGRTSRTLIEASQIAAVIAFLALPLSVSINGESIACGGYPRP